MMTTAAPLLERPPTRDLDRLTHDDVGGSTNGELVRMVAEGDERAWRELIDRLGGVVYRVARRTGLSHCDAADVTQTTWVRLLRNADRIREPERVVAWLVTTARRESIRVSVRSSRFVLTDDPMERYAPDGALEPDVERTVLWDEYDPAIEQALAKLPPVYRRLLRLLFSDARLSYVEIAERMGVPVGSIGPMRLRGLEMLRRDPRVTRCAA